MYRLLLLFLITGAAPKRYLIHTSTFRTLPWDQYRREPDFVLETLVVFFLIKRSQGCEAFDFREGDVICSQYDRLANKNRRRNPFKRRFLKRTSFSHAWSRECIGSWLQITHALTGTSCAGHYPVVIIT